MYVNVTLYKTKLSTTDTMVFSSKEEQTNFFNGLTKLDLGKCSFNGKRTIRINGNYFMLNIGGYNYIKIYYTDGSGNERTYYAFIDLFRYVNDNCCEVDVTTDYIQTYMFDIQFSQLFIEQRNYSIKDNSLLDLQYKNVYPVSNYNNISQIYPIRSKSILGTIYTPIIFFALINTSGGSGVKFKDYVSTIPFNGGTQNRVHELTSSNDIACVIFPGLVTTNGTILSSTVQFAVNGSTHTPIMPLKDFVSKYADSIIDIFCSDLLQNIVNVNDSTIFLSGGRIQEYLDGDEYIYFLISTTLGSVDTPSKTINFDATRKSALFRSPYYNIYLGRDGDSMALINPFDLDISELFGLECEFIQTLLPTYNSIIKVKNTRRKYDNIYSFKPVIDNLVYSISAWSQYKLTNSASVGDSLSTKHAYDMEIAERNYDNARNIASTKFGTNLTQSIFGGITGAISGGAKGGVLGGATIGTSIISGIVNSATAGATYAQELENASVAYENTLTTIEQESALLQIQYDNIKNSPSEVKNFYSGGSYLYSNTSQIKINILEPANIAEIIKYHKRFGFETALQTEITDLAGLHDTNAQYFDYIRTLNCSVISENIPRTSADMIQKIFNSGIYLWRNYEKLGEDYLSNYEGE